MVVGRFFATIFSLAIHLSYDMIHSLHLFSFSFVSSHGGYHKNTDTDTDYSTVYFFLSSPRRWFEEICGLMRYIYIS